MRRVSTDVFDLHLTRDLTSAYILDFNPFHAKTDALLFTYEELYDIFIGSVSKSTSSGSGVHSQPVLRTITSAAHPSATLNAPANQHNAVPFDALQLSSGADLVTFAQELDRRLEM